MGLLGRVTGIAAVAGAMLAMAQPASAAVIFSNNFSNGFGNFTLNNAGNTSITLQTGATYAACCSPTTGSAAALANRFVAFGAGNIANTGYLTTTVATIVGERYRLSYDAATLGGGGAATLLDGVRTRIFSAGGLQITDTDNAFPTFNLDNAFINQTIDFTATSTSTTIRFFDVGAKPNVDAALDNVTLSAGVPEPATWGLMIGGFGLTGSMLRRRRQQVRVTFA